MSNRKYPSDKGRMRSVRLESPKIKAIKTHERNNTDAVSHATARTVFLPPPVLPPSAVASANSGTGSFAASKSEIAHFLRSASKSEGAESSRSFFSCLSISDFFIPSPPPDIFSGSSTPPHTSRTPCPAAGRGSRQFPWSSSPNFSAEQFPCLRLLSGPKRRIRQGPYPPPHRSYKPLPAFRFR